VNFFIRVMSHPIRRKAFTSNILQARKVMVIICFCKLTVNTLMNLFSCVIRVMSHPIRRKAFTSNILQAHNQVVIALLGAHVENFHKSISSIRAMSHQSTGYESPFFVLWHTPIRAMGHQSTGYESPYKAQIVYQQHSTSQ
jgi:hypothetical protein